MYVSVLLLLLLLLPLALALALLVLMYVHVLLLLLLVIMRLHVLLLLLLLFLLLRLPPTPSRLHPAPLLQTHSEWHIYGGRCIILAVNLDAWHPTGAVLMNDDATFTDTSTTAVSCNSCEVDVRV